MHIKSLAYFQVFKNLIEQEIEKYEDSKQDDTGNFKTTREISEPSVVSYNNIYYFIYGSNEVIKLGDQGDSRFASSLTAEQIEDLPESIMYTGRNECFKALAFLMVFNY